MDSLKSLCLLWTHLAEGLQIPSRDRATFERRSKAEGMHFLLKVLPSLGKALDLHLTSGAAPDFTQVRFRLAKDGIPIFLGENIRRSIDPVLPLAVRAANIKTVRQLTLLYYKLETGYDAEILQQAVEGFVERDRDLRHSLSHSEIAKVKPLVCEVLSERDPHNIIPRHGPGAVANRLRNHQKWHEFRFIPRLDAEFPYDSHFFYDYHHVSQEMWKLLEAPVVEDPPSRLVAVPKDSRGPRLICCEPAEFQYIQQGIMEVLYNLIESHRLTKGYVNFRDQSINRDLVKKASIDGSLATLDLSEASDRVSLDLLKEIVPSNWYRALCACRSTRVTLPDGTVYGPLRKFAPMGSACCFPIEGLVFWALIRSVVQTDVWVYGDDIILPTDCVPSAISILEKAGLVVNKAKSCYTTLFRESCGADYFAGFNVGYVKYRKMPQDAYASWLHSVQFCEQIAHEFGLDPGLKVLDLVQELYSRIAPTTRLGPRPGVFYHARAPIARNDVFFKRRFNKDLQLHEHKIESYRVRNMSLRGSAIFHWCELLRKTLIRDKVTDVGSYASSCPTPRWVWTSLSE